MMSRWIACFFVGSLAMYAALEVATTRIRSHSVRHKPAPKRASVEGVRDLSHDHRPSPAEWGRLPLCNEEKDHLPLASLLEDDFDEELKSPLAHEAHQVALSAYQQAVLEHLEGRFVQTASKTLVRRMRAILSEVAVEALASFVRNMGPFEGEARDEVRLVIRHWSRIRETESDRLQAR